MLSLSLSSSSSSSQSSSSSSPHSGAAPHCDGAVTRVQVVDCRGHCKVIFIFLIFHHFPFVWTPNWGVLIIRHFQIFSASQSRHLYCVLQSLWFYTGETGIGIIPIPIECLNLVFWNCIFLVYRFSSLTISCSVNLAQKKSKQKENQLPITPAIFCDCWRLDTALHCYNAQ